MEGKWVEGVLQCASENDRERAGGGEMGSGVESQG